MGKVGNGGKGKKREVKGWGERREGREMRIIIKLKKRISRAPMRDGKGGKWRQRERRRK